MQSTRRTFLKTLAAASAAVLLPRAARAATTRKPNIVLVLTDDLGWAELGCCGNTFNETPNIDVLARQGMRFTNAYTAAPVCSPTRASIMTGQYPLRVGISDYLRADDPNHLHPEEHVALAEALADAGYATGMAGKWHLMGDYAKRRGEPALHGFQECMCSESSYIGGGDYFHPYKHMAEVLARLEGEYLPDRLAEEAVDFIDRHKDEPFFFYLSYYSVHTRLDAPKEDAERFRNRPGCNPKVNNAVLAAMLQHIDTGVGKIMKALDKHGIAGNTVLVFMSDNGGEHNVTSNAPLRGAKSMLYEGGVRVPFIVRWPGKTPEGSVNDTPVCSIDFYPTFLDAAGAPLPSEQKLDGVSLVPELTENGSIAERALYWHYPLEKPHFLGGRSAGSMRTGDLKFIEYYDTGELELYDLSKDIGETTNLAETMPEKVEALQAQHRAWVKDTEAWLQKRRAQGAT